MSHRLHGRLAVIVLLLAGCAKQPALNAVYETTRICPDRPPVLSCGETPLRDNGETLRELQIRTLALEDVAECRKTELDLWTESFDDCKVDATST